MRSVKVDRAEEYSARQGEASAPLAKGGAPAPEEGREEAEEGADRCPVESGSQEQARFLLAAVEHLPGVLVRGVL